MAAAGDRGARISTTPFESWIGLLGDVRRGEGRTAFLMTLNVFLVLVAYYVIKTVREPLILTTGGAELKAYAAACQALVLMVAVPVYSYFASRTRTRRLIFGVTLFFVACIEIFALGYRAQIPMLGFGFFVWVGIFNVAIVAQFWSLANDIYSVRAGERLLPVIAVGATAGAPVGAWIAGRLFEAGLSPAALMQVSAGILLVHLFVYRIIVSRPDGAPHDRQDAAGRDKSTSGGFALVFRSRYLTFIAVLLVLLNLVNSTGEYLLSTFAEVRAQAALTTALEIDPAIDSGEFMDRFFGSFYGDFFFWVNIVAVVVQALIVSRVVRHLGIAGLLLALPIIALGNYGLVAMGFGFTAFRVLKTAENATDYSIMNTARAMLWLPTSHEEKFQAKQAVDTFFVRLGDVIAGSLVYAGTHLLAFSPTDFARMNVTITVAWVVVAALVARWYRQLARSYCSMQ